MTKYIALAVICGVLFSAAAGAAEWHEKIKVGGDIRCRGEVIDRESDAEAPVIALVSDGRDARARIRARLRVTGEAGERWKIGLGLVTGSGDPVSTDETLTGGFSKKGFALDLAYVDFHPKQVKGLNVIAGKMNLPFETADKTQMVWDNDLTPEGAALKCRRAAGEKAELFASAAGFYLTDADPDNEQWMSGGQAGFVLKPSGETVLTAGAGYYDYHRIEGYAGVFSAEKFYGNSSMKTGTKVVTVKAGNTVVGRDTVDVLGYAADFNELELFGTFDVKVNDRVSLRLTGDYVNNGGADSLNTAYLVGGSLAYGKDAGSMRLSANYRKIEADAVLGVFAYSDPWGGGTNGKGYELGFSYGLAKGTSFDITYFIDTKGVTDGDAGTDYNRFQADFQVKF